MAGQAELDAVRRAVELSRSAHGATSPNPPVGAVVLDAAGEVAGEGWTRPPGGPHAEVVEDLPPGPAHLQLQVRQGELLGHRLRPRLHLVRHLPQPRVEAQPGFVNDLAPFP